MYDELAGSFHLLSAPEEYVEEAAAWRRIIEARAQRPLHEVLELGSGAGNNASHLKAAWKLTLVDPAPGMLALSRAINPECEHIVGDMRTVRLDRQFDAVFVHDAIVYMTTAEDLAAAIATVAAHLRPGGVALLAPDALRETYEPGTDHGGNDAPDGRGVRYLEWSHPPDPDATTCVTDYALLIRAADGTVRVEHDRHVEGLFPRAQWLALVEAAGLRASSHPVTFEDGSVLEVIVGVRAAGPVA